MGERSMEKAQALPRSASAYLSNGMRVQRLSRQVVIFRRIRVFLVFVKCRRHKPPSKKFSLRCFLDNLLDRPYKVNLKCLRMRRACTVSDETFSPRHLSSRCSCFCRVSQGWKCEADISRCCPDQDHSLLHRQIAICLLFSNVMVYSAQAVFPTQPTSDNPVELACHHYNNFSIFLRLHAL